MHKLRLGELNAYMDGGHASGSASAAPVVVLLHGFGAPGTDLVAIAEDVAELGLLNAVRWVFPMAPLLLDTYAPEDYAPRAWWPIDIAELQVAAMTGQYQGLLERVPEGLATARTKLEKALRALCDELRVPAERLILGGFSQGAMLATDLTLRSASPPGALAVLSGTAMTLSEWRALLPARRGLPVFQSHGTQDPTLPFAAAELLRDEMVAAGLAHEFVPFRGGHGIPGAVLQRFADFLKRFVSGGA